MECNALPLTVEWLNIEYAQMAHVIDVDHKLMYWNDREEFLGHNELFHRKMDFYHWPFNVSSLPVCPSVSNIFCFLLFLRVLRGQFPLKNN